MKDSYDKSVDESNVVNSEASLDTSNSAEDTQSTFDSLNQASKSLKPQPPNLTECYDALPIFTQGKKEVYNLQEATVENHVTIGSNDLNVEITAAILTRKNHIGLSKKVAIFPGDREKFVEAALRKLAVSGAARHTKNGAMIEFSLYQLQEELIKANHTYNYDEITEALQTLRRSHIKCTATSNTGDFSISVSPINALGFKEVEISKGNVETLCTVDFNSFINPAIKASPSIDKIT